MNVDLKIICNTTLWPCFKIKVFDSDTFYLLLVVMNQSLYNLAFDICKQKVHIFITRHWIQNTIVASPVQWQQKIHDLCNAIRSVQNRILLKMYLLAIQLMSIRNWGVKEFFGTYLFIKDLGFKLCILTVTRNFTVFLHSPSECYFMHLAKTWLLWYSKNISVNKWWKC